MAPGGEETPELRRLVDALRRVIGQVVTSEADPETLISAAIAVEGVAERLAPTSPVIPVRAHDFPVPFDPHAFFPYSPVIGHVNPLASPIEAEKRDGRVFGRGRFGAAYEGPPGRVHGAMLTARCDGVFIQPHPDRARILFPDEARGF